MATAAASTDGSTAHHNMTDTLTTAQTTPASTLFEQKLKNRVALLDTVHSNFSDNTKKRRRTCPPPVGLEAPYNELYTLLHPCLVEHNPKSNVAALVMGKRGTGKTLVVERALASLQLEGTFRIVRINGLVIRGDDVSFAVKEIIRQLSDIAMVGMDQKKRNLLKLRQSSFTSNLALLDEVLRMACIDRIPILIVLDEFDALLGSTASLEPSLKMEGGIVDRQLLLYHLLDRVTTQGTLLSLVAITSHLAAVSMLEKRVKSRAEGVSKVIFLNPYPTYERLVEILLSKISNGDGESNNADEGGAGGLREAVSKIISKTSEAAIAEEPSQHQCNVQQVLERNFALGKEIRWFCRVVACALALYREDVHSLLRRQPQQQAKACDNESTAEVPLLTEQHFVQALMSMNASFACEPNLIKVGDQAVDPRMQALLDLSGPQVALLLAAKRILARDAHSEDSASPKPLTLQRMISEYQSYRGPHRYHERLLVVSFTHLLETDVLRPSADHTGGGPLQYGYSQNYYAMDASTKSRMPLHFPVDMDRELGEALKQNLLECSTSLREWGRKKN